MMGSHSFGLLGGWGRDCCLQFSFCVSILTSCDFVSLMCLRLVVWLERRRHVYELEFCFQGLELHSLGN